MTAIHRRSPIQIKMSPVSGLALILTGLMSLPAPSWAMKLKSQVLVSPSSTTRIYDGVAVADDQVFFTTFASDSSQILKAPAEGESLTPQVLAELPKGSAAAGTVTDPKGDLWIADFKKHQIFHLPKGQTKPKLFTTIEGMSQPNDLVITKEGVLYATDPNWMTKSGKIWRITPDKKAEVIKSGLGIVNGIALSPDEKTLYIAESAPGRLISFDLSGVAEHAGATGTKAAGKARTLGEPKLLKKYPHFQLDGIAVDDSGRIYVPLMKAKPSPGKKLEVLDAKGQLITTHPLYGESPSNITITEGDQPKIYISQFGGVTKGSGAFIEKIEVQPEAKKP